MRHVEKDALEFIQYSRKRGIALFECRLPVETVFFEQVFRTPLLAGNVDLFLPGILRSAIGQFHQDHFRAAEVFANRQAGGTEGEIFLADTSVVSDEGGAASFSLAIPVTLHSAVPPSFTATVTSSAGATSEFSKPVALAE